MKLPGHRLLGLVVAILMLLALPACAAPPGIVHHGFSFGDINGKENQGIEILDYRYGDDKTAPTRPADWQLATGKVPQRMYMGTFAHPADSLYVKWRDQLTAKVYETTVDLKSRLPWDMDGKEIHFTIQGSRLSVYVIEYIQEPHAREAPDCPATSHKTCKCSRIYPDHWKNF